MLYKQLQFTTGWFGRLMFKFDSKIDIRFDDVIGYDAQKIKLRQAISKILNNQESKPKGIIIKGPEGTRFTLPSWNTCPISLHQPKNIPS